MGHVDCIIPELSEVKWDKMPLRKGDLTPTCNDPDLTLSKAAIAGRHMWVDLRSLTELFISDDLCAAFKNAKLRGGWVYRQHKEI